MAINLHKNADKIKTIAKRKINFVGAGMKGRLKEMASSYMTKN